MKLFKFLISVMTAYLILKAPGIISGKPVPEAVFGLYFFFTVVMILLVMTASKDGGSGLVRPVMRLLEDPSRALLRNAVFVVLPLAAAFAAYKAVAPVTDAPHAPRVVHPAPPASFGAWGKTFDLSAMTNPYRETEYKDPVKFKEASIEGGAIYFKNCFFCHGAKLDGRGHYAAALNPRPLPFTGGDTIAQLQESYVFWRIAKGGVGLPAESAPWLSSMPAWERYLSEDEVWKVVIFLYDYTGNRPRAWEARSG